MSSLQSNREAANRALDLRGVHDAVQLARNHASSARALIRDDTLGTRRLDAAITVLDALLADLRWGGVPAMTVTELAAKLNEHGLRPVIDHDLDYVVADCPDCAAQDTDPLGIWRPLRVIPRALGITFWCASCDIRREAPHV